MKYKDEYILKRRRVCFFIIKINEEEGKYFYNWYFSFMVKKIIFKFLKL